MNEYAMIVDSTSLIELRSRMMSVAYRMLGSVADAEDVVQDAFLRFQSAQNVESPTGFLVRVTTNLCIDRLRSVRRHEYIGPWVPDPVQTNNVEQNLELAESLTQAFLLMLERLTPEERAAYLLRSVFDYEYSTIANILEKTEVHVRQIVSRARQRLNRNENRSRSSRDDANEMARRFIEACRLGDTKLVEEMLSEGIEIHSDGGGIASAARVVIRGRERAARFLIGVFRKRLRTCEMHSTSVNGEPGIIFSLKDQPVNVAAFSIQGDVSAVFMMLNPEKLRRWAIAIID